MGRLSDLPESKSELQNGHSTLSKTSTNGSANGSVKPKPDEENSPGLVQLAICVGGIYASLYGFFLLLFAGLFQVAVLLI